MAVHIGSISANILPSSPFKTRMVEKGAWFLQFHAHPFSTLLHVPQLRLIYPGVRRDEVAAYCPLSHVQIR